MPSTPGRKKKIVICCDGTGNEFGRANSNVVKLYTCLTVNNDQVAYYHPGVGTMGAPSARTWLGRRWSIIKGLAFGAGFMANVEDAYRYLMATYDDGDQVYLFGFSRGAYTVRALAAILHAYGLLCRGNEGHVPYLLRMFASDMAAMRRNKQSRLPVRAAFKETFSHSRLILHFVGLWDTVSAIGWIYKPVKLLYAARNPIIQTGRHAVSIDERRCFYRDNLWGEPLTPLETPMLPLRQSILQVWFPGAHSDVGGSYPQRQSALANNALAWLLKEARIAGLEVDEDRLDLVFGRQTARLYSARPLYVPPRRPGQLHNELKGAWWLLELLPLRTYDQARDDASERWQIPLGRSRSLRDQSIVHASVVERMSDPHLRYAPRNLPRHSLTPLCESGLDPAAAPLEYYRYTADKEPAPPQR